MEKKGGEESIPDRGNSICKGRKQHCNAGNNEQFVYDKKVAGDKAGEAGRGQIMEDPTGQAQECGLYPSRNTQFS